MLTRRFSLFLVCAIVLLFNCGTTDVAVGVVAADFTVGDWVQVLNAPQKSPLNVRQVAGTSSAIIDRIVDGQLALIIEGPIAKDRYGWWKIQYVDASFAKKEGWVASDFLTFHHSESYFPADIPLGKIAFGDSRGNVRITDSGGGKVQKVTVDAFYNPTTKESISYADYSYPSYKWSPDGRYIAVGRVKKYIYGGQENQISQLVVIDVKTLHEEVLLTTYRLLTFDWTPDSETLAVSEIVPYSNQCGFTYSSPVKEVKLRGSGVKTLFEPDTLMVVSSLNFSPDGKFLEYNIVSSCAGEAMGTLCVLNLETRIEKCSSRREQRLAFTAWSPDSKTIFSVPDSLALLPTSPIYTVDPRTLDKKVVAPLGTGSDSMPKPSPDGSYLAFIRSDVPDKPGEPVRTQLWVLDRGSTAAPFMVARDVQYFSWSPDSQSLVFEMRPWGSTDSTILAANISSPHKQWKIGSGRTPLWQPANPTSTIPIILIHGCGGSIDSWKKEGWIDPKSNEEFEVSGVTEKLYRGYSSVFDREVFGFEYGDPKSTIEQIAEGLPVAIDKVKATTKSSQVLLVSHSMGAIVSRLYLEDFLSVKYSDRDDAAGLYMLAPPNQGSFWMNIANTLLLFNRPKDLACKQSRSLSKFSPLMMKLNMKTLPERLEYVILAGDEITIDFAPTLGPGPADLSGDGIVAVRDAFFVGTASDKIRFSGGVYPVVHSDNVVSKYWGTPILSSIMIKKFIVDSYRKDFDGR